ncbi:hypothetical protein PR048_025002 [Dryococelus australis]|uniref:Uncharacterized protein n=1 Tax=Dryococelus australis TaxID=614101 RepID=A0ABQ9GQ55_9NEOP|nr:hypothetical protein PR048_025002 [Dryococelus australis]
MFISKSDGSIKIRSKEKFSRVLKSSRFIVNSLYLTPTKANRVRFPDFHMWDSCRTTPLIGVDLPFPPVLSFRRCSINIGSQDLAVRSRPNLVTPPPPSLRKGSIPAFPWSDLRIPWKSRNQEDQTGDRTQVHPAKFAPACRIRVSPFLGLMAPRVLTLALPKGTVCKESVEGGRGGSEDVFSKTTPGVLRSAGGETEGRWHRCRTSRVPRNSKRVGDGYIERERLEGNSRLRRRCRGIGKGWGFSLDASLSSRGSVANLTILILQVVRTIFPTKLYDTGIAEGWQRYRGSMERDPRRRIATPARGLGAGEGGVFPEFFMNSPKRIGIRDPTMYLVYGFCDNVAGIRRAGCRDSWQQLVSPVWAVVLELTNERALFNCKSSGGGESGTSAVDKNPAAPCCALKCSRGKRCRNTRVVEFKSAHFTVKSLQPVMQRGARRRLKRPRLAQQYRVKADRPRVLREVALIVMLPVSSRLILPARRGFRVAGGAGGCCFACKLPLQICAYYKQASAKCKDLYLVIQTLPPLTIQHLLCSRTAWYLCQVHCQYFIATARIIFVSGVQIRIQGDDEWRYHAGHYLYEVVGELAHPRPDMKVSAAAVAGGNSCANIALRLSHPPVALQR